MKLIREIQTILTGMFIALPIASTVEMPWYDLFFFSMGITMVIDEIYRIRNK